MVTARMACQKAYSYKRGLLDLNGAGTLFLFPTGFLRFDEASGDLRLWKGTWIQGRLFTGECQNLGSQL